MRWKSKIRTLDANHAPLRALVSALPTSSRIHRNGVSPPDSRTNSRFRSFCSTSPARARVSLLTHDVLDILSRVVAAKPQSRPEQHEDGDTEALASGASGGGDNGSSVIPPTLQGFKLMPTLRFLETLIMEDAKNEEKELVSFTISSMSSSTFSEMLRCLDPVTVIGPQMDPHFGHYVSAGRAQHTQFMNVVDIYGVRGVYMLLLQCVAAAVTVRTQAGRGLLISDYKQLMRCAGATCDPVAARKAYQMMDEHGVPGVRDGDLFTEFCKARFLTEPLYTQFDMARRRVYPINLFTEKGRLGLRSPEVAKLRRLRRHIIGDQAHRYGQNRDKQHAEHLTRILRKKLPIGRLWRWHGRRGYQLDEDFVCTAMIAFARVGSMTQVRHMLYRYWWIQVQDKTRKHGKTVVRESKAMRYGNPMRPTARLCAAVVECFGCNGEIVTALQVLMHIAVRYKVTIPDQVWFDLFSWTQVRLSKPASTEWDVLNWPNKAVPKDALAHIWRIMTSEPYNVRPGWDQYDVLIRYTIASNGQWLPRALDLMMDVYPQYEDALKEVEEAAYEMALSSRPGMDRTEAMKRWSHAVAKKEYMWYSIVFWCWNILKKFRPHGNLDSFAVRLIPKLVERFDKFFPRNISYRIATGTVVIRNADPLRRTVRDRHLLLQPALVTGDMARNPWDTLKPLKYRDVPLASFHRRKMIVKTHRADLRHSADAMTNQLRAMLTMGSVPVALLRHFT